MASHMIDEKKPRQVLENMKVEKTLKDLPKANQVIPKESLMMIKSPLSKNPPLPFSAAQQVHKQKKDQIDILEMFKKVHINIPLLDAVKRFRSYAKVLKDACINKWKFVAHEKVMLIEECSAVLLKKLPPKLKDLGSFTIPCIIGDVQFDKAFLDLGSNINLMPLSIFQRLGIGELKSTNVSLQLADRSVTYPKGIIEEVLIRMKQFVFPADFFILNMEEDHDIPLLLGWPFLASVGTLIDVQQGTLTLRVQGESIEFKVFEAVKKLGDLKECSCIDLLDPIVHVNYLEITCTDVLKAKSPPTPYGKCMRTSLGRARIYQCFIKSFSKMSRPLWHRLAKDHTKTVHDKAIVRK